eukprot:evm.model.scf_539.3 EVM.evm.TU.scf_539.3   scf_539:14105-14767(-)
MITWDKAAKMMRGVPISMAASRVVSGALAAHNGPVLNDTTVVVLDIAPPADGASILLEECDPPLRFGSKREKKFRTPFSCLFGYTDVLESGKRGGRAAAERLKVLARIDAVDLAKSFDGEASSSLRRAASACLPPTTEKEEFDKADSAPAHWAPAFLSAQRARLGGKSAGNRGELRRAGRGSKPHYRRLRGTHRGPSAEGKEVDYTGLFYERGRVEQTWR